MKYLITGGSGFIGSHLINSLLSQNDGVESILNIDLKDSNIKNSKLKTLVCDIRDELTLTKALEKQDFDVCVHLAALCKEPGYEWDEYFVTNHLGTKNIIEVCVKLLIPRVIFTSTMMVYQAGEIQRTESSTTSPDTAYGISKLLAEKELEKWKNGDKTRTLKVIRPAVVFGENENANFTRLYKLLKKGFFPYVGKSTTTKSNIYVQELVNFISFLNVSNSPTIHYNFSFPESSKISEIIKAFKRTFGFKAINPVIPMFLLLTLSRIFEFLNALGLKNSIHHRRIEKLYHSTDIFPQAALNEGYNFKYTLESALIDWKRSGDKNL